MTCVADWEQATLAAVRGLRSLALAAVGSVAKAERAVPVEPRILPGRACGACSLCCKVLSISELQKPQGVWCKHCSAGQGCRIYSDRPDECRSFYCGYLVWNEMDETWFPAKSKLVVVAELDGGRTAIHVDPSRPDAWRKEPYFSTIKRWAAMAVEHHHQVVACIGKHAIVVLPDREIDLGLVGSDEVIITQETRTPAGVRLDAVKLKADDPRLGRRTPGVIAPFHWPAKP